MVNSTGITCQGTRTRNVGSDDHQYRAEAKKVTVIVDTIPDKRILVDTGGPPVGTLLLGLGLVGLGILVLRRA